MLSLLSPLHTAALEPPALLRGGWAPARARLGGALVLLLSSACSSTGPRSDLTGGQGGSAAATSTSTTSSPTTTTTAGSSACDEAGSACGDDAEPGCQGCAIDGPCQPQADACLNDPLGECLALNQCYIDCPPGEQACVNACDAQHSDALAPLEALLLCIFCVQCPVSCNIDSSTCPDG